MFVGLALFLNFGSFPLMAQKDADLELSDQMVAQTSKSELTTQQRVQQQRAYYAAYVKKLKTSAATSPSEHNRGGVVEGNPSRVAVSETSKELFSIYENPYVPDFILQGNYVINSSSPDKRYTAYIYPDDWETIGDIYIKDSVSNSWERLQLDQECRIRMWNSFAPEGKYTPKKQILWLNNEEFITIIGFAHGTISKGGELVKVTRLTGKAEILYPAFQKLNQEVVGFEQVGEELTININILDANGLCLDKEEIRIPLEDLDALSQTT